MRCCDNCTHYSWYYDWCDKWKCDVDSRSVCDEWTAVTTIQPTAVMDVDGAKEVGWTEGLGTIGSVLTESARRASDADYMGIQDKA